VTYQCWIIHTFLEYFLDVYTRLKCISCYHVLSKSISHTRHKKNVEQCPIYCKVPNAFNNRSHCCSNMKGTAFFLVILMAAILLLLGEYKQIMTHFKRKSNNNIYIFNYWINFGVRTTIFNTNGPKSATDHGISTVGTATFNAYKISQRPILILSCHSLLHYAFRILTIFCNMLSAIPVSAACCIIKLWGQVQQCRMLQMLRSSSFGGRL
jgi:hypothetical protein